MISDAKPFVWKLTVLLISESVYLSASNNPESTSGNGRESQFKTERENRPVRPLMHTRSRWYASVHTYKVRRESCRGVDSRDAWLLSWFHLPWNINLWNYSSRPWLEGLEWLFDNLSYINNRKKREGRYGYTWLQVISKDRYPNI